MPVKVFISYSHDSPEHRERVLALAERLRADGIEAWIDQYESGSPPEGWPRWMLDRIDDAAFVLCVCTAKYYRRFRGHADESGGKGVDWEGAHITQELYDAKSSSAKFVPVMLEAGQGDHIPEPLRSRSRFVLTSAAPYDELCKLLRGVAGIEAGPLGTPKPFARETAKPMVFPDDRAQRVAPSRLTHSADRLFGRDDELAMLDRAWSDPKTHVVTLVAWGGVGKTSLVAKWAAKLAQRDYDGADYFDWSFYSQGTKDQGGASADAFVDRALRFFGDEALADSPSSPWDKGARLAELVAERRTLLVLDGLEPLQHPPGPLAGSLKDPAITALLKRLAQKNRGLCVVTTRERVTDLAAFRDSTAPERELERLSTEAGVALLESLHIQGSEQNLRQLVEDVDGHALTIDLLGRYLAKAHGGDVRRRDRVELTNADAKVRGGHAFKTIAAYETWLAAGGENGRRQLAILRVLGLFDRPAGEDCIAALRCPPAILGLTEPLVGIDDEDWNTALAELAACRLVTHDGSGLDAHPLIREHFARRLRAEHAYTWAAAHGRLFDHLKGAAERWPNTIAGLQPLYQAVVHGCLAGRQEEARDGIYRDRILRGEEAFSTKKLGAAGADLGAVACFFEKPWSVVSPSLTKTAQAWLLNEAGFSLHALGRLTEAAEPMRAAMLAVIDHNDWGNAAAGAGNLSELDLTLGDLTTAIREAEESVEFADRSGDAVQRFCRRATLANALHQAGRRADALTRFHEAEVMQAELQPEFPLLYSVRGFHYCELLLADAERAAGRGQRRAELIGSCSATETRATRTLAWAKHSLGLLTVALNYLAIGRARLYRGLLERTPLADARPAIEQAVNGLRGAGSQDDVPRGLLTRAWLRSAIGDNDGARADLDEAREIAERGPMPLHLADVHLHRARLFRDRKALADARALIDKHHYERRRGELDDAEELSRTW